MAILSQRIWMAALAACGMSLGTAMAQPQPPGAYLMFEGYYPTFMNDGNLSNPDEWVYPVTGTPNNAVPGGGDDAIVESTGNGLTNVPNGTLTGILNCWGAGFSTTTVPLSIDATVTTGAGGLGFSGDAYGPSATSLQVAASTAGPIVTQAAVNINAALTAGLWMYASGNTQVLSTTVSSSGLVVVGGSMLSLYSGSTFTTAAVGTIPALETGADFYSTTTALQIEASTLSINGSSFTCNGDAVIGTIAAQTGSPDIGVISVDSGGSLTTTGVTRLGVINPSANYGPPLQGEAGTGDVFVNGAGSLWHVEQDMRVGDDQGGSGFIYVQNGAKLQLDAGVNVRLGSAAGGFGVLTFDGTSSTPTLQSDASSSLIVGDQSYGTLNVQDGASITHGGTIVVGNTVGSVGTIAVTDANSSLTSAGDITLGNTGTGTASILTNGTLTASGNLILGSMIMGSGTLNVGQAASPSNDASSGSVTVAKTLIVGEAGTGDLEVTGGTVTVHGSGADLVIGDSATGVGTMNITGNSAVVTAGQTDIGNSGSGIATISGGGALSVNGKLSVAAATGNGTLTVTDTGSAATVLGEATVGDGGTGTLNVFKNATFSSESGILGNGAVASGTANVTGTGSTWNDSGDLTIANNGSGQMAVSAGGTLHVSGDLTIGSAATGTGLLTLDGAATTMTLGNGDLTVGSSGTGTLNVQNGIVVDISGTSVTVGDQANSNGTLLVTDPNTTFSTGDLTIGSAGTGTLTLQANASLHTAADATIGDESGGTGTATIDTAAWNIDGSLTIGGTGKGQLDVDGDGTLSVSGSDITLGEQSGGKGTLIFNGAGAAVHFTGPTTVGAAGSGTLIVEGGASVTLGDITLGDQQTASGKLTVDGTGVASMLHVAGALTVAGLGSASVSVTNAGSLMIDGDMTMADSAKGGNSVGCTVDEVSNLSVGGNLTIGSQAAAALTVDHGSTLGVDGETVIGEMDGGAGTLTVRNDASGQFSTFTYGGQVTVGQDGAGKLAISGGATVTPGTHSAGVVLVGVGSLSNGAITVDGAGSQLTARQLIVGGSDTITGGVGSVTLTNSGAVAVSLELLLWKSGSINTSHGSFTLGDDSTLAALGTLRVNPGGTLDGFGKIKGKVVNAGGVIRPGGDPGTLEIDDDFEQDSGILDLGIAGSDPTQYNQLLVTGNVTLNGTVLLDFVNGFAPSAGQTFDLISAGNSFTLLPGQFEIAGLEPGWQFQADTSDNGLVIDSLTNAVAVPEPSTIGSLLASIAILVCRRRRRATILLKGNESRMGSTQLSNNFGATNKG